MSEKKPITREDIRAMRERVSAAKGRADAATEPPWRAEDEYVLVEAEDAPPIAMCERDVDASFIANAREDVPQLSADVEQLSAEHEEALALLGADGAAGLVEGVRYLQRLVAGLERDVGRG